MNLFDIAIRYSQESATQTFSFLFEQSLIVNSRTKLVTSKEEIVLRFELLWRQMAASSMTKVLEDSRFEVKNPLIKFRIICKSTFHLINIHITYLPNSKRTWPDMLSMNVKAIRWILYETEWGNFHTFERIRKCFDKNLRISSTPFRDWVFAYTQRVLIMYVKEKNVAGGTRHWHLNFLSRAFVSWHSTQITVVRRSEMMSYLYGVAMTWGFETTEAWQRESFLNKCITLTLNCHLNFNNRETFVQAKRCSRGLLENFVCSPKWSTRSRTSSDESHNLFLHKFHLGLLYPFKTFSSFIKLVFFIYMHTRLIFHSSTLNVQCRTFFSPGTKKGPKECGSWRNGSINY